MVEGTEWYYALHKFSGEEETNRCYIEGDTLIQDKICQRFIQEKTDCNGRPAVNYLYKEEDQIYFYDESDSTFKILYDFGLEVGDTMTYVTGIHSWDLRRRTHYISVDSTSVTEINGVGLQTFHISYGVERDGEISFYNPQAVIIQGIGNTANFFHFSDGTGFCDYQYSVQLQCFASPDFPLAGFSDVDCKTVSVVEKVRPTHEVRAFPNPVYDMLTITSQSPFQQVKIFDIFGKELHARNWSTGAQSQNINLNFLPPSMYYLQIGNPDQVLTVQRIMKAQN